MPCHVKEIRLHVLVLLTFVFLAGSNTLANDSVQYANLGDFQLDNGSVIRDCRLGYLTTGTLNAEKSNIILVPTWLAGTSKELFALGFIGPGKLFDSSKYFIIAVDSFGNGVSSSPSNSRNQPGKDFPQFSIRDMVRAQYLLLTEKMNIHHVYAVVGISMGSMQTFEWMVFYPDFMDRCVPILGGPWTTSHEMLFWSAQLGILENILECKGSREAMKALTPLHVMQVWTRDYRTKNTSPSGFSAFLAGEQEKFSVYDAADWASQVRAIMSHDILKNFGGSRVKAAETVRAKCLIITSEQDQITSMKEARTFACLIHADVLELNGACGHFTFFCDHEKLKKMVHSFLSRNVRTTRKDTGKR
ncbi:MAG: alpha/beta fold hydrolase [Smithellaceae bacterium]|nr:alpha/beta fold hydrolase [Smithellaceae bacterium]